MYLRIPISGGYVCIHAYLYWWQVDLRALYRQSYMRFVAYICVYVHIYLYLMTKKKIQAKLYAVRGIGDARARALCDLDQGYFDLYVKGDVLM